MRDLVLSEQLDQKSLAPLPLRSLLFGRTCCSMSWGISKLIVMLGSLSDGFPGL